MNRQTRGGVRRSLIGLVLAASVMLMPATDPAAAANTSADAPWQVVLRVETPAYSLDAAGLRVAGYGVYDAPGAPALPIWSTTVELPAEGEWELSFESAGERLLPVSSPLPAVPSPQALVLPWGWQGADDLPEAAPRQDRPDPAIYGRDAFYPAQPVQGGPEGWQRGRRLLAVRVFPFQYNPIAGTLRFQPDLRVTVRVRGTGDRRQETGDRRQETGGRRQETGDRSQESGDRSQESGDRSQESGDRRQETGDRSQETGDGRQETGGGRRETINPAALPQANGGALRIRTAERGLYRLRYSDLVGAGVPVNKTATFAMTYLGLPIAIEVRDGNDGSFDPDDLVVFYAEPYGGRYMTQNVYWFTWGGMPGPRMGARTVQPAGAEPIVSTITQTVHVEFDRSYYSTYSELPKEADHFFDNPLYANAASPVVSSTYTLPLDDPLAGGEVALRVALHGGLAQSARPDQSVAVALNGHRLVGAGIFQWDGSVSHLVTTTVPAAWLDTAPARLTLEAALDQLPGLTSYWVSPDWVEATYPARADAEGDRLYVEAVAPGPKELIATGFSAADVRGYDVSDPRYPLRLSAIHTQLDGSSYTAHLWDDSTPGRRYYLAGDAGLLAPLAVERDAPSAWRSPANAYDYVAIVHRTLSDAIQPLLDYRTGQGYRVAKVDVQDVYDEFSDGLVDPEAIRAFLSYAYANWNSGGAPPRYVLLVGDGHYDFKGVARPDLPNLIPPYLIAVDPYIGETAADNRYVSVDSPGDNLPDMHIGRIPAKTPADVTAVVDKIIAYETAAPAGDWQSRVVFVADSETDPAGNFHALSDEVRLGWLPPAYQGEAIYYRMDAAHDSGAEMQTAIRAAFDRGALMLQWFGHASRQRWGSVSMFDVLDPTRLKESTAWPLTASYTCWSGYFINIQRSGQFGTEQSLAEALLLTPRRGAVADLSPSGLHVGSALLVLNEGIVHALLTDRVTRVGQAVDDGKAYLFAQSGSTQDLIDTMILFGDPATKLRLPPVRTYLPAVRLGQP